jgi:hypothetical protein
MLPATTRRVQDHTDAYVNEAIQLRTEQKLAEALADGPYGIEKRLAELDREWDIERACMDGAHRCRFCAASATGHKPRSSRNATR